MYKLAPEIAKELFLKFRQIEPKHCEYKDNGYDKNIRQRKLLAAKDVQESVKMYKLIVNPI